MAGIATSETGVGLLSFGGVSVISGGVSVAAGAASGVSKAFDGNLRGAALTIAITFTGFRVERASIKVLAKGVEKGLVSHKMAHVLETNIAGTNTGLEQMFDCVG